MEYVIGRLYADGVRMPYHVQRSASTLGTLTMTKMPGEAAIRGAGLVISLRPVGDCKATPDLCDARLLGALGQSWVLGGYEETPGGPVARARRCWQVWLVEPAAIEDLIRTGYRLEDAMRALHKAQERLKAAGLG